MQDFFHRFWSYITSSENFAAHDFTYWLIFVLVFLFGLILGLIARAITAGRLKRQIMKLENRLEFEAEQQSQTLEYVKKEQTERFARMVNELAREALMANNDFFLKLASENMSKHQSQANEFFAGKQEEIEKIINPLNKLIDDTKKQITQIEKERKTDYGSITEQLKGVNLAQEAVKAETQHLVQALRRPEVRGQWGEITLRRLLELSGMNTHADFSEQLTTGNHNLLRPDVVVHLPENRSIVIDAKTPLDAYINSIKVSDPQVKLKETQRHARNIRTKIRELASKQYWQQFSDSPDFVVLFIPGDAFLSLALEADDKLLENALEQKIILATPTSLVALLRTINYGWKQFTLSKNAEEIKNLSVDLHKRFASFLEHLQKTGKSLQQSVESYNSAIGSLERLVIPSMRKFEKLGIDSGKELLEPHEIETTSRSLKNGKT